LLADVEVSLVTLRDLPAIEPPEETGKTFAENARLKARYYAAATGLTTVAEDSGLVVDALGGRPGIESARYAGAETSYPDKFERLYAELRAATGHIESPARFVCSVAVAREDAILFEAEGTIEGRVAERPAGTGGFGYDPIFFYPPFDCTLAEAGERKALVSHRAAAFRKLADWLRFKTAGRGASGPRARGATASCPGRRRSR